MTLLIWFGWRIFGPFLLTCNHIKLPTYISLISFKQVVCFQGIMLVYDITNEKSFENIKNWIRNIEEVGSCLHKCIFMIFLNNNMICQVIMFYSGLNTCCLHLYQVALIKFVSAVCLCLQHLGGFVTYFPKFIDWFLEFLACIIWCWKNGTGE